MKILKNILDTDMGNRASTGCSTQRISRVISTPFSRKKDMFGLGRYICSFQLGLEKLIFDRSLQFVTLSSLYK